MRFLSLALLFFLFSSIDAHAYWTSEGDTYLGSTSDQIDYSKTVLEFSHDKSDFFWPYKHKSKNEWGLSLRADRSTSSLLDYTYLEAQVHKAWNTDYGKVKVEAGSGTIEEQTSASRFIGSLTYENTFKKKLQLTLKLGKGFAAPVVLPLNSIPTFAFTEQAYLKLKYTLGKKWDLQMQQRTDLFSNSNTRNWFDTEVMYAISRFPVWARVGAGLSYLKFKKSDSRHWSPQKLFSYGPRVDLGVPLYKKLSFVTGGSYNFFQEDSFTPGDGHYLRLGLSYGDRESLKATFFIEDSESTQNNNVWSSRFYQFNIRYSW